jgi:hypothetical protein
MSVLMQELEKRRTDFREYFCGQSLLMFGDKFQYSNFDYNAATITNTSHKHLHAFLREKR